MKVYVLISIECNDKSYTRTSEKDVQGVFATKQAAEDAVNPYWEDFYIEEFEVQS